MVGLGGEVVAAVQVDVAVAGWGDVGQGLWIGVEGGDGVLEVDGVPADDGIGQQGEAFGLEVLLVGVGGLDDAVVTEVDFGSESV